MRQSLDFDETDFSLASIVDADIVSEIDASTVVMITFVSSNFGSTR